MSDEAAPESAEDLIQRANLLEDTRRSLRSEREGLVGQAKEKRASVSVTREKSDSRRKHYPHSMRIKRLLKRRKRSVIRSTSQSLLLSRF